MNIAFIKTSLKWLEKHSTWLHNMTALASRLCIANVFFTSGWLKITDWDTTLFLFEEEYQVPLLSPLSAAVLGTAGELILPILLVLGLGSRPAAIGLFFVNTVAVISLSDIAPAALYLHGIWALLIAQIALYGAGWFSADYLFKFEFTKNRDKETA